MMPRHRVLLLLILAAIALLRVRRVRNRSTKPAGLGPADHAVANRHEFMPGSRNLGRSPIGAFPSWPGSRNADPRRGYIAAARLRSLSYRNLVDGQRGAGNACQPRLGLLGQLLLLGDDRDRRTPTPPRRLFAHADGRRRHRRCHRRPRLRRHFRCFVDRPRICGAARRIRHRAWSALLARRYRRRTGRDHRGAPRSLRDAPAATQRRHFRRAQSVADHSLGRAVRPAHRAALGARHRRHRRRTRDHRTGPLFAVARGTQHRSRHRRRSILA